MNEQVPPHFHKEDRISEIDIIPDSAVYTDLPRSAEEGRFAIKLHGSTYELYRWLDGDWRLLNDAGANAFVGCRLYNSGTLTAATATLTALTWDTETYDTDTFHSTSANPSRITIPAGQAGKYAIHAQYRYEHAANGSRQIQVTKNGTNIAYFQKHAGSGGGGGSPEDTIQISTVQELAEGDYIEIKAYQDSGTTLDIIAGSISTYFEVYKVG